jgi:cytochrome P450
LANEFQGVVTLAQHPEQLAQLKSNPSLAPQFVEELCRFHTASALAMKRTAKEDVEIGGKVSLRTPPYKIKTIETDSPIRADQSE